MAKLKSDVIKEANRFAASRGKVAVPVSVRKKPIGSKPGEWVHFEYQFKLVEAGQSGSKATLNLARQAIAPRDVAIDTTQRERDPSSCAVNSSQNRRRMRGGRPISNASRYTYLGEKTIAGQRLEDRRTFDRHSGRLEHDLASAQ